MSYPADSVVDFSINHRLDIELPDGFSISWGSLKEKESWIQLITETMGYRLADRVIEQFYGTGVNVLFCYDNKGSLAGTCGLLVSGKRGKLGYTAVKSEYRRCGLGSSMVSFIVNEAFKRGCSDVIVQTSLNRPVAMRLYLGLGFEFEKSTYPITKEEVSIIAGMPGENKGTKQIWSRIGSKVAGWWIDLNLISDKSIIYAFGLGSDISFELDLLKKRKCSIYGFDPTPGVMKLWENKPEQLHLYNYGLDAVDCKKVMSPLHEGWVTYTVFDSLVVEKDKTRVPETVELKRLTTIMKELKHTQLDVLKIDIEGCEYQVIDDVITCKIKPKLFMIEWHKLEGYSKAAYIKKIEDYGYTLGHIEDINYVFVRQK